MKALELGERLQLEEGNFGNYKGYDLLISEFNQGYISYPMITFRFENKVNQYQFKKVKEHTKKLGALQLDNSGYGLILVCGSLSGKVKEQKLEEVINRLDSFIDALKQNELVNLHSCVICRQQKEEELENHIVNDRLILCHGSCFEEYKNYHLSKIRANEGNTKNYPKSIVFAALMGIVGYLPFLLILLFSGYMVGILYMLIPIAAFWGYKKGNAPLNKKATLIIIAVSAVVMLLGVYGFLNLYYETYKLLAEEAGELIVTFNEFVVQCLGDIAYCIIFGALGIFWSYRTITKDNNEKKLNKLR